MIGKKKVIIAAVGIVTIAGASGYGIYQHVHLDEVETVTKESKVEKGNLTVGITESGSVTLGTVEQKLEIDLTENTQSTAADTESNQTGNVSDRGMEAGMKSSAGGAENVQSSQSDSSGESISASVLEIEEIYVSQGQTVEKGTPLLKVKKDSVSALQTQLEEQIKSKQLALKSAQLERKETKIDAEYEYKQNITAGKNAKADYQATLDSLQSAVDEAKTSVNEAKERMKEIPKEIKELQKKKKSLSQTASNKTSHNGVSGMSSNTKDTATTGNGTSTTSEANVSNTNTVSGIEAQIYALQSESPLYNFIHDSQMTKAPISEPLQRHLILL